METVIALSDEELRMLIDVLKGELVTLMALEKDSHERFEVVTPLPGDWFEKRVRFVTEMKERLEMVQS